MSEVYWQIRDIGVMSLRRTKQMGHFKLKLPSVLLNTTNDKHLHFLHMLKFENVETVLWSSDLNTIIYDDLLSMSQLWLWNLINFSIAAKPIILQNSFI